MFNGLRQKTGLRVGTQVRVDPKVVLTSQILQLSGAELEQAIESELMENPALERIDDYDDPVLQEEILRAVAPDQLKPSGENRELQRSLPPDGQTDHDWVDMATSVDSLWDHLMAQLRSRLSDELLPVGVYYVGSLNERGYLNCTVEDAALDCDVTLEEAEEALKALKDCEPAGVGASDLRECLALQLRSPSTDAERLARMMVRKYWDELVARNRRALSRQTGAPDELVEEAFEVILGLDPFPGESFARHHVPQRQERVAAAQPDVVILLDEFGYVVEVPGPSPIHLRVNRAYEKTRQHIASGASIDPAEKRHIMEFTDRAERFLEALGQRRKQLAQVGKYLIERQGGFVRTGEYRFLVPLTRSQVAKDLGVHESTISRATNGKFVQIVTKDVISFDVFFKPALRVQKMIEEILANENPDSPLSDERIAQMLAEQGIEVARRTVNKYRDRTKLLSSRMRRSA